MTEPFTAIYSLDKTCTKKSLPAPLMFLQNLNFGTFCGGRHAAAAAAAAAAHQCCCCSMLLLLLLINAAAAQCCCCCCSSMLLLLNAAAAADGCAMWCTTRGKVLWQQHGILYRAAHMTDACIWGTIVLRRAMNVLLKMRQV